MGHEIKRRRRILLLLAALLVLVGVPVGLVVRRARQEQRNQALIAAIKQARWSDAVTLLAQGVDANTTDHPPETRSAWQLYLDALLNRKRRVSGPSALLLALRWRPGNETERVTSKNEVVVNALLANGATMGVSEILARMAHTYAFCQSYQDTGSIAERQPGDANIFNTRKFNLTFARPDRFHFEYWTRISPSGNDSYDEHYVIWRDRKQVSVWWSIQPGVMVGGTLNDALSAATGVSARASYTTPSMLDIGVEGNAAELTSPLLVASEVVDGFDCYKVSGQENPGYVHIFWIDKRSFLLRKQRFTVHSPQVILEDTTVYHPQVNRTIDPKTFTFTPPKK